MSQASGLRSIRIPGVPDASISERDAGAAFEPMQAVGEALSMFGQLGQQIAVKEQRLDDQKLLLEIGREARESNADLGERIALSSSQEEVSEIESEIMERHESFTEKAQQVGSQEARQEIENDIKLVASTSQAAAANRRRQIKVSEFRVESDEWARKTLLEGVSEGNLGESIDRVESYYANNVSGLAYSPQQAAAVVADIAGEAEYQDGIAKIDAGDDYDPFSTRYLSAGRVIALSARKSYVSKQRQDSGIRDFESSLPFVIESAVDGSDPMGVIGELHSQIDSLPYSNKLKANALKNSISKQVIGRFAEVEMSAAMAIGDKGHPNMVIEDLKQMKSSLPKSMATYINEVIQEVDQVPELIVNGEHKEMQSRVAEVSRINNTLLSEVARGDGEFEVPYSMDASKFRETLQDNLPKQYRNRGEALDAGISRFELAMVHSNLEDHVNKYREQMGLFRSPKEAAQAVVQRPSDTSLKALFDGLIPQSDEADKGVDTSTLRRVLAGEETDEDVVNAFRIGFDALGKGIRPPDSMILAFSELSEQPPRSFAQSIESMSNLFGLTPQMIPSKSVSMKRQLFAMEYLEARGSDMNEGDALKFANSIVNSDTMEPAVLRARLERKRLGQMSTQADRTLGALGSMLLRTEEVTPEGITDDNLSGSAEFLESYGIEAGMDAAQLKLFVREAENFDNLFLSFLRRELPEGEPLPNGITEANRSAFQSALGQASFTLLKHGGETSYTLNPREGGKGYAPFAIEKYYGSGVGGDIGWLSETREGVSPDMTPAWVSLAETLAAQGALEDDYFWNQVTEQSGENADKFVKLREHLRWHINLKDMKNQNQSNFQNDETVADRFFSKLRDIHRMDRNEFRDFSDKLRPNLEVTDVPVHYRLGDGKKARNHSFPHGFFSHPFFSSSEGVFGDSVFFRSNGAPDDETLDKINLQQERLQRLGLYTHDGKSGHVMIGFGFKDDTGSPMNILRQDGTPYNLEFAPLPENMAYHPDAWTIISNHLKKEQEQRLQREPLMFRGSVGRTLKTIIAGSSGHALRTIAAGKKILEQTEED